MSEKTKHGLIISIEGLDGTGKTTQTARVVELLEDLGWKTLALREPGGTELGEQIRTVACSGHVSPLAELLLYATARAEIVETVIRPAVYDQDTTVVVLDRYIDSTYAYQGGTYGLYAEAELLEDVIVKDMRPDLTLFLAVDLDVALERIGKQIDSKVDRFLKMDRTTQLSIQRAYQRRVLSDPNRFAVIDANQDPDTVFEAIKAVINAKLLAWQDHGHTTSGEPNVLEIGQLIPGVEPDATLLDVYTVSALDADREYFNNWTRDPQSPFSFLQTPADSASVITVETPTDSVVPTVTVEPNPITTFNTPQPHSALTPTEELLEHYRSMDVAQTVQRVLREPTRKVAWPA